MVLRASHKINFHRVGSTEKKERVRNLPNKLAVENVEEPSLLPATGDVEFAAIVKVRQRQILRATKFGLGQKTTIEQNVFHDSKVP